MTLSSVRLQRFLKSLIRPGHHKEMPSGNYWPESMPPRLPKQSSGCQRFFPGHTSFVFLCDSRNKANYSTCDVWPFPFVPMVVLVVFEEDLSDARPRDPAGFVRHSLA